MNRAALRSVGGFTMIELIVVIVLTGILAAVGASRFFDNTAFESRVFSDQAKTIFRFAQKLAITQNRMIFVRTDGNRFAVCSAVGCGAGNIIAAPGGSNSGSRATRANCLQNNAYSANWMCEGRPEAISVAGTVGNGVAFDALGRPYVINTNNAIALIGAQANLTFTSGSNSSRITIWPETGYVQ